MRGGRTALPWRLPWNEFLAKHLGGRYQETMQDDIAERLAELMVDVNTVRVESAQP